MLTMALSKTMGRLTPRCGTSCGVTDAKKATLCSFTDLVTTLLDKSERKKTINVYVEPYNIFLESQSAK